MEKSSKSKEKNKPAALPDKTPKTATKSSAEMTDQDLDKVSGGPTAVERTFQPL